MYKRQIVGVVYTPAADGCGEVSTEYIEIFDEVQADWDNPTPLCQADLPYQLQLSPNSTEGGTWSGFGVDDNGLFGESSQTFVVDFSEGETIANGSPNPLQEIYEYEESGMNIATVDAGSSTNFFEFVQTTNEFDMILEAANEGSGVVFTYNGNDTGEFDLVAMNID